MKRYFLSMNKILKYNDISGNDYSDSIELYSSREECMKYACQNLKAYACGIADMQYIKEYITDKLLSRPEIDFKMKDKNVSCIITKNDYNLRMEISQKLIVSGQPLHISIIYHFLINEIEEENVAYAIAGKHDSEISSYNEIFDDKIYDSLKDVLEMIDKLHQAKINNICEYIICIVDKKKVEQLGLREYEKQKRKLET